VAGDGSGDHLECWTIHAKPDWSEEHLDDTPEQIVKSLLSAFHDLFPGQEQISKYYCTHSELLLSFLVL
jgi:predicted NAD/FAD-dependent oxidoreductase